MTIKTIPDQKTSGPLFHEIEERNSQTEEGWVSENVLTGKILRESKQAACIQEWNQGWICYQGFLAKVNKALLGWAWVCVWYGQSSCPLVEVFECLSTWVSGLQYQAHLPRPMKRQLTQSFWETAAINILFSCAKGEKKEQQESRIGTSAHKDC